LAFVRGTDNLVGSAGVQEDVVLRGISYAVGALVLGVLVVADKLDPTSELAMPVPADNRPASEKPATGVERDEPVSSFARYRQLGMTLHGKPASLQGTDVDGELRVDAQGNLLVSIGVRRVFDYFLSTLGEEDLETIKARIATHLGEHLPATAAQQAWRLLNNYLDYQHALSELPLQSRDAKGVRNAIKQRQQLRQVWLGAEVADAFFGFEDALDNFTVARMEVMEHPNLSDQEKQHQVMMLEQNLPSPILEAKQRLLAPVDVGKQVAALRESGASEAQVRALREQTFGAEAAARFEQLDRERAQWDARYQDYTERRASILASGLAEQDQQHEIERLQRQLFDELEVRRVQALDRIGAQAQQAN
jgi:lipase chaperone LimK